jgi:hypothetical protein
MAKLGSFWMGDLSPLEIACLSSFAEMGHEVVVYSYAPFVNLPRTIANEDANSIVNSSHATRFITDGQQNVAHFSDYFRYVMFSKTQRFWIDSDVLLQRDFLINPDEIFVVDEVDGLICNAILRLPSGSTELNEIIKQVEQLQDKDVPWAATQSVISKVFRSSPGGNAVIPRPPRDYMPIASDHFFKLLLPEYKEECSKLCASAYTLHLYNNILSRIGYYKFLLPPKESYLNDYLTSRGYAHLFIGCYPADTVRKLVEGWHLRFSGNSVGIRALLRQVVPSIRRTYRRCKWNGFRPR